MPYLNLDPNYPEHPKTIKLIAWLGELGDAIPIRLWAYCARIHPKDGHMKGYSEDAVETVIRWRGEQKKAVNGLIAAGFIRKTKSGFICTDWRQHQGHLEAFSRRGRAAAKARWNKYATSIAKPKTSNAPAVPSLPTTPTVEDVRSYCLERQNGVDPQRWHDFYSAKGWLIGKSKMKDWKAAVRTWERSEEGGAAKKPSNIYV